MLVEGQRIGCRAFDGVQWDGGRILSQFFPFGVPLYINNPHQNCHMWSSIPKFVTTTPSFFNSTIFKLTFL